MHAFITGCGSGFGLRLARRLVTEGHHVVATDPVVDGLTERIGPSERLCVLPLDVRDGAAVSRVATEAEAFAPIDTVVNNAGVAVFGTQEEVQLDAVADMFDVNALGSARVAQAFLPSLRSRRGTIVQLSSVAGRMVFPESGYYAATKYAVEAMMEALFQETATFGVRVRLVEPGAFATRFQEHAEEASEPRSKTSPYVSAHSLWDARRERALEPPQDPDLVVDAIVASLADPAGFRRLIVGKDAVRILARRDSMAPDLWSVAAAREVGFEG